MKLQLQVNIKAHPFKKLFYNSLYTQTYIFEKSIFLNKNISS